MTTESATLMGGEATTETAPAAALGAEATAAATATTTEATAPAAAPTAEAPAAATETKTGAQPEGAPESYEDFAMPEGLKLDDAVTGDLKALAKELNLPQAAAQKIADLGAGMAQKWATAQQEQFVQQTKDWASATKADKEIGGEKLQASLSAGEKALNKFASPALREVLTASGMANHPEVIRFMAKVGKTISEDGFVQGGKAPAGARDAASILYGNSTQ